MNLADEQTETASVLTTEPRQVPALDLSSYREMVEAVDAGLWRIDEDAATTFVNRKAAEVLGYAPEEMLGRSIFDFMDEEARERAREPLFRPKREDREPVELPFRRKDGTKIWIALSADPLNDERGKYRGTIACVRDVTRQRRANAILCAQQRILGLLVRGDPDALRESLTALVHAIEAVSDGVLGSVLLLDDDGKRLWLGAAPSLPAAYNQAIQGGMIGPCAGSCGTSAFRKQMVIVADIETDPLWKDYRSLASAHGLRACWSRPILDRAGRVLGTFAMYFRDVRRPTAADLQLVQDATAIAALAIEHVRTRESLAKTIRQREASEKRFRALAQAALEGIAMSDGDSIVLANLALAKMFGYEPSELLGMRISALFAPGARAAIAADVADEKDHCIEAMGLRKDGSTFWFESRTHGSEYEGRAVRVTSFRDISDRKALEQQRENNLLKEREARLAAERWVKTYDEFLAMASHELRTPLTPLKLLLQQLRRTVREAPLPDSPRTRFLHDALERSERELNRLHNLVEELLEVSRMSAGAALILYRAQCDLSTITRDVVARVAPELERAQCPVELRAEPGAVGYWDRARIEEVVTNLLTNALKFGAGHPIDIRVWTDEGTAKLSVRDHGPGVSSEMKDAIFERFTRAAPIEHYPGLGLGLYIVHRIVRAHGGSISLESKPGEGACFVVELPLVSESTV